MPTLFVKPGHSGRRYVPGHESCPHCRCSLAGFADTNASGDPCPQCGNEVHYMFGHGPSGRSWLRPGKAPTLMGEADFLRKVQKRMQGMRW